VKAISAAIAAFFLVPLMLVLSITVIGADAEAQETAAATAAAVACTYGNPDPARIAIAMEQMGAAVDETHYNQYAADAGIDTTVAPWSSSTAEQRSQVLRSAIRTISYTVTPRTVATPVLVWWDAPLPVDDTDTAWESVVVTGYGTLGEYVAEYLNVYAVDPVVLASVTAVSCSPSSGRCLAPDSVDPILATIRTLESGGNYAAQAAGSSASGAYQFVDGTCNNYGGYRRAVNAPPDVQDAKASDMVFAVLEKNGNDVAAVPVVWYLGHLPAPASASWDTVPAPNAGNVLTPRQYQTRWVNKYLEIAGENADTCPAPQAITDLAGPDCDGLKGTGATYNGKINGTLNVSDLQSSTWGPLQPAAVQAWTALVEAGVADGWTARDFAAGSGGPGSRNGGYSNHTIGLAVDLNKIAWTPTRNLPGEPLAVAHAFDEPFYQWMRNNAWRFGWCNPRALRPYYLNGSATGGRNAAGTGSYLEQWHFEFVGGSDYFNDARAGDLNGPLGIPD
jgi:hypothetical protein